MQFLHEYKVNKLIYAIKIKYISNQTLDPKGGDIIQNKIILPMREFKPCFNELSSWQFIHSNGGISYEYPKEILDRNARIHHHDVVFCIIYHKDYI